MNLRTYRAYTMAEALNAVKRDLGVDASVLSTRTYKRGGLLGIGRRTVVEVTAAPAGQDGQLVRPRPFHKPPLSPTSQKEQYAVEAKSEYDSSLESRRRELLDFLKQHGSEPAEPLERSSNPPIPQPVVQGSVQEKGVPKHDIDIFVDDISPQKIRSSVTESENHASQNKHQAAPVSPVAQRFILKSPPSEAVKEVEQVHDLEDEPIQLYEEVEQATPVPNEDMSSAQEEIRAIRSMVSRVLEHQTKGMAERAESAMSKGLFEIYVKLIDQELAEELADQIVKQVERELPADAQDDSEQIRDAIAGQLIELIPRKPVLVDAPPADGRPLTIALIGPTGVGKTTTVAKLAATFKLHQKQRVGLVTSDTYRIAAVDQLRTYANIIGLPVKVVLTPGEMKQACYQLRDCDVILIDTAGRSQRDSQKLDELNLFLNEADPHEVHLVLSGTAGEKVLLQEAEAFSGVRADQVILTKLDEAVSYGLLINVLRQIGKSVSYVTTGQEVPDHIEPGSPQRLVDLVLGADV